MGEMHEFFESYGGEEAFIAAMADDPDAYELERSFVDEKGVLAYLAEFGEPILSKYQLRRKRIKENGGTHTKTDLDEIRAAQGDKCIYCNINLRGRGHKDHIIPLSRGGGDGKNNIQLTCQRCNDIKGNTLPDELYNDITCSTWERFFIEADVMSIEEIAKYSESHQRRLWRKRRAALEAAEALRNERMNKWLEDYARSYADNAEWRAYIEARGGALFPRR
jgi:hypothetical protein